MEWTCVKFSFKSKRVAMDVIKRSRRNSNAKLEVYWCEEHQAYHIGSNNGDKHSKKRRYSGRRDKLGTVLAAARPYTVDQLLGDEPDSANIRE